MSTVVSSQHPKFPWDCEVPDTRFWNDLTWKDGRAFLNNFSNEELDQMSFDESLNKTEKLNYLQTVLEQKLESLEASVSPQKLHDTNYRSWEKLYYGITQMEHSKGNFEKEEGIYCAMSVNGPGGSRNYSALHNLAWILEIRGKYEEAQSVASDVQPWLESHDKLGPNSSQVIGSITVQIRSNWKLGKRDKAQKLIEDGFLRIEAMKGTKFDKCYEDEYESFAEAVTELKTSDVQ